MGLISHSEGLDMFMSLREEGGGERKRVFLAMFQLVRASNNESCEKVLDPVARTFLPRRAA